MLLLACIMNNKEYIEKEKINDKRKLKKKYNAVYHYQLLILTYVIKQF